MPGILVQDVGTDTAVMLQSLFAAGDQVNSDMVLKNIDRSMLADMIHQCVRQGYTGCIGGMNDASKAVAAFPC